MCVAVLVWVHVSMDMDECNISLLFSQLLSPTGVAFMRPHSNPLTLTISNLELEKSMIFHLVD